MAHAYAEAGAVAEVFDFVVHHDGVAVGALGEVVVIADRDGVALGIAVLAFAVGVGGQDAAVSGQGDGGADAGGFDFVAGVFAAGLAVGGKAFGKACVVAGADHPVFMAFAQGGRGGVGHVDVFVEGVDGERATVVAGVQAYVVFAALASLFTKLVVQVGFEACHVGGGVDDLVAPAGVGRVGCLPVALVEERDVLVQHQGRERERVTERVHEHGGQKVGRNGAAHGDSAKVARQADQGIAREEEVAVKAAGGAGVVAHEAVDGKAQLEATAQVFGALKAKPRGGHATAVDHGFAASVAWRFDGADIHIDQARGGDGGLGVRCSCASQ